VALAFWTKLGFADDYLDSDWSVESRPDLDMFIQQRCHDYTYVPISLQWCMARCDDVFSIDIQPRSCRCWQVGSRAKKDIGLIQQPTTIHAELILQPAAAVV